MKNPSGILFAILCLFLSANVLAQPPIQWKKTYGGSDLDEGRVIRQTFDGGFIFVGTTGSPDGDVVGIHGLYDAWIVKMGPTGAIEWKRTLGGTYSEFGHNVRQTADSGYVVVGNTRSSDGDLTVNHGNNDAWVVKLSKSGSIVWQKSLGGPGNDLAYSVDQTFDGGYIIAGTSDSVGNDVSVNRGAEDFWVVKLSPTGVIQWERSYGGSDEDIATSIIQTSDTGYIVAGTTESSDDDVTFNHGMQDVWVIKLSKTGAIEWQKTYGGSDNDACGHEHSPASIKQTADGYVFAGWTASADGDVTSNHGDFDFWVVKLSPTGSITWQKTFGGSADDEANCIQQTADGGYIVAGVAQSSDGDVTGNHGGYDYWLVKLTAAGSMQWQKAMGGAALGLGDCAYSVEQTSDLGYIVGGYSESTDGDVTGAHGSYDFWAVKLLCASGNLGPTSVCKGDSISLTNVWLAGSWSTTSANVSVSSTGSVKGLAAGPAVITYTVSNACGLSRPMTFITVNALPTPVITSVGLTMTTTIPYASYQWYSSTGSIGGAHAAAYTAPSYGGAYRVYVTDSNGCSDTSAVFRLLHNGVANTNAQTIGIYPNPASGGIYIHGAEYAHIKLFDAMGRLVKESSSADYIDVSGMTRGCYSVQIWNDRGEMIYRETLLKQ